MFELKGEHNEPCVFSLSQGDRESHLAGLLSLGEGSECGTAGKFAHQGCINIGQDITFSVIRWKNVACLVVWSFYCRFFFFFFLLTDRRGQGLGPRDSDPPIEHVWTVVYSPLSPLFTSGVSSASWNLYRILQPEEEKEEEEEVVVEDEEEEERFSRLYHHAFFEASYRRTVGSGWRSALYCTTVRLHSRSRIKRGCPIRKRVKGQTWGDVAPSGRSAVIELGELWFRTRLHLLFVPKYNLVYFLPEIEKPLL